MICSFSNYLTLGYFVREPTIAIRNLCLIAIYKLGLLVGGRFQPGRQCANDVTVIRLRSVAIFSHCLLADYFGLTDIFMKNSNIGMSFTLRCMLFWGIKLQIGSNPHGY